MNKPLKSRKQYESEYEKIVKYILQLSNSQYINDKKESLFSLSKLIIQFSQQKDQESNKHFFFQFNYLQSSFNDIFFQELSVFLKDTQTNEILQHSSQLIMYIITFWTNLHQQIFQNKIYKDLLNLTTYQSDIGIRENAIRSLSNLMNISKNNLELKKLIIDSNFYDLIIDRILKLSDNTLQFYEDLSRLIYNLFVDYKYLITQTGYDKKYFQFLCVLQDFLENTIPKSSITYFHIFKSILIYLQSNTTEYKSHFVDAFQNLVLQTIQTVYKNFSSKGYQQIIITNLDIIDNLTKDSFYFTMEILIQQGLLETLSLFIQNQFIVYWYKVMIIIQNLFSQGKKTIQLIIEQKQFIKQFCSVEIQNLSIFERQSYFKSLFILIQEVNLQIFDLIDVKYNVIEFISELKLTDQCFEDITLLQQFHRCLEKIENFGEQIQQKENFISNPYLWAIILILNSQNSDIQTQQKE